LLFQFSGANADNGWVDMKDDLTPVRKLGPVSADRLPQLPLDPASDHGNAYLARHG
jgi:hypothetical protein